MQALVSIVIPTYNRAELLKETIDSVLNQTYKNYEILICDDGSTDKTKDMVLSYNNPKIIYFYQSNHGCPAPARNMGLKNAKGQYIAFLDSDDLWFPKKLEIQIAAFEKYPQILLIATNSVTIPPKKNPSLSLSSEKIVSFEELIHANIIMNSSVLMKQDVIQNIGLLDERLEIRGIEDFDYWLRLLQFQQKSVMILPEPLVKYREHSSNLTVNQKTGSSREDFYLKQHEQFKIIFEKFQTQYKALIIQVLHKNLIMAYSYKFQSQYSDNRISTWELLQKKPMYFKEKIKAIIKKTLKQFIN